MEKTLDKSNIRKILIRAVNWVGDAVMTTPALGAIRNYFPDARITMLANPLVAELFRPHPWVDEVMIYDRKGRHAGIGGRLKMAAELKAHHFDLAILLQNALDAAFLVRLARIPRRTGYRTDGRGLLLTHGVTVAEQVKKLHHVEYYLAMLAEAGIPAAERRQFLYVSKEEEYSMACRLAAAKIGSGDFLLGINPGAAYGSAKRWYPERFARVADELALRWGCKVVITGGPEEIGIAADIEKAMQQPVVNMAGRTSVRELMALIKRCNFFVTNDSGPMHVAAAFDVPLVAIFGPTDHTTTSPLSAYSVIVRQETDCAPCLKRECSTDHRCMAGVTAQDVIEGAKECEFSSRVPGAEERSCGSNVA